MAQGIEHALARLRRFGKGVWRVYFVVYGYDSEFLMHAPGNLSKKIAVGTTRITLARALRVGIRDVIHQREEWESP